MELFPIDAVPDVGYQEVPDHQVVEIPGPGAIDQVVETLPAPFYRFSLSYDVRDADLAGRVIDFFYKRRGPAERFYFYSFYYDWRWNSLDCGAVSGVTTTLVPVTANRDDLMAPVVRVNGATLGASEWSWGTPEAVAPFRNRINFVAAQTGAVQLDVCGRRLYVARFSCGEPLAISNNNFGYGWQFKLKESS